MKLTFTKNQWARISEILGNGGLLVCGSVIIPFFLDKQDVTKVTIGLVIAVFLWYSSIKAARKY